MSLSNLQLETYFIDEIQCKTNKDYLKKEKISFEGFDVTFESGINANNPLLRRIVLTIKQENNIDKPYEFKLTIIGIFSISESFAAREKESQLEKLINTNCPSILYTAAREIILTLTSRQPNGSYMLPTIAFSNFEVNEKK